MFADDLHQTIPSMVAFTPDGSKLIGHDALCQAEQYTQNTIYDAKRFIGKTFDEESLRKQAARYPFKVLILFCLILIVQAFHAKKLGQPRTNCNRKSVNCFIPRIFSSITYQNS